MTVQSADILRTLSKVLDPCSISMRSPIDICTMGLVESVEIDETHVRVSLLLTDPSCVHFRSLQHYITDVLLELDGVASVEVAMSTSRLWTPDRLRRSEVRA